MTFDQSDKVTWPDQEGLSSNIPDHLPTCVPTKYPQKLFVSLLKLKICSKSPILLSRMCFGFRISSLIHLATLTIPIQDQKCPKNASGDTPFPFEVQLRLCRLYTCTHRRSGSLNQICVCRHSCPSTTEDHYLCVIVMFHFLSLLIFRVHCCGEAEST